MKGVGREFTRKGKSKEEKERDEKMLARLKMMEDGEMDSSSDEEEKEKVAVKLVFTKKFAFEPKGKKVDFGASPPSLRGDLSFSWS